MFTKLRMVSAIFGLFILLAVVGVAAAATLCIPVDTRLAVATVGDKCDAIGSNQACYGNMRVLAKDRNGAEMPAFSQPGALANVADLGELYHYPMDAQNSAIWGITRMNLSMGMPVDSPFIAFGAVLIKQETPVTSPTTTTNLTAAISPNSAGYPIIRSEPNSDSVRAYNDGIPYGTIVSVLSRTENSEWALVRYEDTNETQADGSVKTQVVYGWVRLMRLAIDPALIPVQPATNNPMQAFNLALSDTTMFDTCDGVPHSGVLIQSAEGNPITLKVNGVFVYIGSTALLQPKADGSLRIINLDGAVAVRDIQNLVVNVSIGHYVDVVNGVLITVTSVQISYSDGQGVGILLTLLQIDISMPLPSEYQTASIASCEESQLGEGGVLYMNAGQPIMIELWMGILLSREDAEQRRQTPQDARRSDETSQDMPLTRWGALPVQIAEAICFDATDAAGAPTCDWVGRGDSRWYVSYTHADYFVLPPQMPGTSFTISYGPLAGPGWQCTINVTGTAQITVPSNVQWQNTGIRLRTGQQVTIAASGQTNLHPGFAPYTGPDGRGTINCPISGVSPDLCPMADQLYGMLIGRVGGSASFAIGTGVTYTVQTDGMLFLTVNDNYGAFVGNIGSYTVTITIGA